MRRMLVRLRDRGSYDKEAAAYGLSELSTFKFVPEGTVVAPRIVPGGAASLPYMRGFGPDEALGDDLGFGDGWPTDGDEQDGWGDEAAPTPRPAPPPPRAAPAGHEPVQRAQP